MGLFILLTGLLAQAADLLLFLVRCMAFVNSPYAATRALTRPGAPPGEEVVLARRVPQRYVVRFQLTGAELFEGRVIATYRAPGVRLFETDELNVIWAELVGELGTSPYRLGLEILAIDHLLET